MAAKPGVACSLLWFPLMLPSSREPGTARIVARAGLGDLDNARALLARVLADEVNARSVMLWQRYLAFEGMVRV